MYANHHLDQALRRERSARAQRHAAQAHPVTQWAPGRSRRPIWVALMHIFFG